MNISDLTNENIRCLFTKLGSLYSISPDLMYRYQVEFLIKRLADKTIVLSNESASVGEKYIALIKEINKDSILIWFDINQAPESKKLYIKMLEIDEYFGIDR